MREFSLDPKTRRTDCLNGYGIQWRSFNECYLDSTGTFRDAIISILSDAREAGADSAVRAHRGGTGTCESTKAHHGHEEYHNRPPCLLCGSSQCILDEVKMAHRLNLCPTDPVGRGLVSPRLGRMLTLHTRWNIRPRLSSSLCRALTLLIVGTGTLRSRV
jgi:hypothetical protein